jgi:hypothetical protein
MVYPNLKNWTLDLTKSIQRIVGAHRKCQDSILLVIKPLSFYQVIVCPVLLRVVFGFKSKFLKLKPAISL